MKFYLAAPFFNDEQRSVLLDVETEAATLGLDVVSPRKVFVCPPDADAATRRRAFEGNLNGICTSDFVLARIDDFDPGTVFEIGYAYGDRESSDLRHPKIYAFTTVEGRGLNLMLAQGVDGFLQGIESVKKFLREMAEGNDDSEAKKWFGNII